MPEAPYTRREVLRMLAPLPVLAAACRSAEDGVQGPEDREVATTETVAAQPARTTTTSTLTPTPSCDDGDDPTPQQTAGPFFTPDSPERSSLLETGVEGERLVLSGSVLWTDCSPAAGALLDFWQADTEGRYDNEGYRLRGHQFADGKGRYRLETVVPGSYGSRTRHIHVRVQAPDHPMLTTQLYFPGEPRNTADGLFDPRLLVGLDGAQASFDFVLRRA